MTDDYFFNISFESLGPGVGKYLDSVVSEILIATADMLKSLIIEQIGERLFDTIYDNMVHGIVDFGQYRDSWNIQEYDEKRWYDMKSNVEKYELNKWYDPTLPEDKRSIKVYSDDEKAKRIEYGSAPEENADLTWNEILAWAKRKNVDEPLAKDIYQVIKYERGTVPKPAVRRSLDMIIHRAGDIEKAVVNKMSS